MSEQTGNCLPPLPGGYTLSPEFRLAAACSWIAPGPLQPLQDRTVASLCGPGIDWDSFLALVGRHGIPVQALTVLRRCPGNGMPEAVHRELRDRGIRNAARSVTQMTELVRIKRLFGRQGIEIIPLKGVCLSQKLYGSPGVRAVGDMDILIRPEDLIAADRILSSSGYRKPHDLTEGKAALLLRYSWHVTYSGLETSQQLELHWRNRFWTRDATVELWRGKESVEIMGERIPVPDDPLLFLLLCDHGARHRWYRLKWLGDVAMMLAGGSISDWDDLIALAGRLGLLRVLSQTALLVSWLYGIPLPLPLAEAVSGEKSAQLLVTKAVGAMIARTDEHLARSARLAGLRDAAYFKRIRPSLPIGLFLKECLMSPIDYTTFPLPDRLLWVYPLVRPFFWFWRHFGRRFFDGCRSINRP